MKTSIILAMTLSLTAMAQNSRSWRDSEKNLVEPALCDIQENPNLCECFIPTEEQENNSVNLSLNVLAQLSLLEAQERLNNRELDVVLIARSGTNLDKIKTYSDVDSNGNPQDYFGFIHEMIQPQARNGESGGNGTYALDWDRATKRETPHRQLNYSHVSIAVKNAPGATAEEKWKLYHLLYSCVDSGSSIFKEGLAQFFRDDMTDYSAKIMVPTLAIQKRLKTMIVDDQVTNRFLTKHYNAAALYYDHRQQNSNGWVLEMMAAAMAPQELQVKNRTSAISYLQSTGYMGTKIRPTGLYSLMNFPLASSFLPKSMCLKAQPAAPAYALAEIVSVLSIEEYLNRQKALLKSYVVRIQPQTENRANRQSVKCERSE